MELKREMLGASVRVRFGVRMFGPLTCDSSISELPNTEGRCDFFYRLQRRGSDTAEQCEGTQIARGFVQWFWGRMLCSDFHVLDAA